MSKTRELIHKFYLPSSKVINVNIGNIYKSRKAKHLIKISFICIFQLDLIGIGKLLCLTIIHICSYNTDLHLQLCDFNMYNIIYKSDNS